MQNRNARAGKSYRRTRNGTAGDRMVTLSERAGIGYAGRCDSARMIETDERAKMVQRALLVGAYTETAGKAEAESLLAELEDLVDTLGVPVIDRMLVQHRETHARHLIGSGKAAEISAK